ncbi:NAD(P)H dehydrogenase (quinone) [Saccharopolyspora erythraea NRRL 2338]|uniref:Flavodoxin/nitric oxide synthase n=2 Tax=Saccharopolyspora erythraea TaxID=1836 RepID=A4FDN4_SACEN|nr:NAD(P)H:quinone oxidoreductase [Saccharopolyspora erythraea]EQD85695.1 TrpR binding protein WrbA [Saccharopolyspora erythraea D]PFG95894.1 NAD(P)H dehydrogenase (quinone) [Saccharopolyspora erythraea NRRL 2338]QRK92467.1 NAD(P)H:quinone oxidoreductase [Saccharopolyspora erythraea]CAM02159.1 flavodoxin/nitric oxide synthase [Saccharopolyspora erythraea NRRL 2338]
MSVKVAVIYYSSTGNVHALAQAVREGAEKADAEVRFRRVDELAPDSAIDANPAWRAHADATKDVEPATHEDLKWADAYAFGTPVRFGDVASQLKQFIDSTGGLWYAGELSGKPFTGFTSAINMHGGNEATLLSLYHVAFHWGSVIVPPGYNDPAVPAAYGNPYGASYPSGMDGEPPNERVLAAARFQGYNLATVTARLLNGARG